MFTQKRNLTNASFPSSYLEFILSSWLEEVCLGAKVSAIIDYQRVPILPNIKKYLKAGCSPGGAQRNFDSYGHNLSPMNNEVQSIICDPQTSGGLLIMVAENGRKEFKQVMRSAGFELEAIGEIVARTSLIVQINE
ncbi:MAG: hypothetical protein FXV79_03950 [Candidatus Thioglobus sp.]|nr:MAG: hypothetical protein FXV79_03950 [Candidatus Thioglobus sp.]